MRNKIGYVLSGSVGMDILATQREGNMRRGILRFVGILTLGFFMLVPMLLCSSSLVPTLLRGNDIYAEERTDAESSSAQVFVQVGHSNDEIRILVL